MLHRMTTDWDARYAEPGWAFGLEPNDFLREAAATLRPNGRVLCLAEGEGRNAVWLAGQGHSVTAVDSSRVGLDKARELAAERGVPLRTIVADLGSYDLGREAWDAIVSIFAHVPPEARRHVHAQIWRSLVPGGLLLLEAYRPEQLAAGTGGPPDDARMLNLSRLRPELGTLEWLQARELERDVSEGRYHTGRAHVVQLVGRRGA